MTPRPARRSVLKAGAWTAPAVVVAGAAPAYAGSLPVEPTIAIAVQDVTPSPTTMEVTIGFSNPAMAATSAQVRLSVSFSTTAGSRTFPAQAPLSQGPDWAYLGATPGGTFTFTRVGFPAVPVPFTFTLSSTSAGGIGTVNAGGQADDATFSPGNGGWNDLI